ncbi:RHS repeat-associated core domain-containing protein [uncultured Prevotella sp.]|uniref:RHS repeat domain-containing protein n=1 Tax=uncultured Prevotella sp. TaxID=159272 RepID=UPI00262EB47E|nr:RHS repeat-associated core domain-containing protein [uncultured Prevotella sp.]
MNYYDNYTFLQKYSAELGSLASDFQVKGSCAQGLQTGKVQTANDGGKVIEVSFYDSKGQPADTRRLHVGKRLTCTHTDYSYTGKPTKVFIEEYSVSGNSKSFVVSQIIENVYSKKTDKLLSTSISVNGKKETTQRFEYDDLGRIKEIRRGNHTGAVSYDYNLHGWTTNIGSKDFHEELHYTDGVGTPCFNGNISSLLWSTSDYGQVRGYKFEYDGLDRLKEAVYGETPSLSDKQNRYNEKVIEYTANGAMKRFQRRGRKDDGEYGKIDNLHIKLNGNQLLNVVDDALPANKYSSFNFIDGANETVEYEYNGVGALAKDLNRGITIRYDNLDYPRRIDFKDGNSITYTYLPDRTLLSKEYGLPYNIEKEKVNGVIGIDNAADRVSTEASSLSDTIMAAQSGMIMFGETEYSGNIIYKNGKLDKVLFPGGYCTFDKEKKDLPIFHYYTQDHLGNNRTVTNEDGTVEQIVHYYPFGGTFNDAGLNASLQQYKYNGKELDRVAGLNTYDYGARQYFSALPVWDRVDPKCEEDYGVSPYAYCRNNPMKFIDKKGEKIKVPYIGQRETIVGYINQYTSNEFIVSPDGFLSLNKMSEPNKDKSQTYANRLIDAINADNTINIYIFDTYETEYGTKQISDKGEGVTIRKDDYNIDVRITGKEHNVINEKGEIMKQSAADILMHELVGHAIPRIAPSRIDTGNAIKNENIIRKELNVEEREEDEAHMQ